jgi:transcriptional regulator with XRE-family HTH domain
MIGYKIRQIRIDKGLTQQNIAYELNISLPGYSKLERGVNDINFTRLAQIAQVFGMSVTELINYGDKPVADENVAETKEEKDTTLNKINDVAEGDCKEVAYLKKIIELLEDKVKTLEKPHSKRRGNKVVF